MPDPRVPVSNRFLITARRHVLRQGASDHLSGLESLLSDGRLTSGRSAKALSFASLVVATFLACGLIPLLSAWATEIPRDWQREWPNTDFSRLSVSAREIIGGGPPRDGIPPINKPLFISANDMRSLADQDPVISVVVGDIAHAYPLRILIWHEIVNDVVNGRSVAVTYCPLCNAAIVFDRKVDEQVLTFGTTGKLRNSDLIMYDKESESWWQQFTGASIAGEMVGRELLVIPSRLESWARFKSRHPDGKVLLPNDLNLRPYGSNPYIGYEQSKVPFLYKGPYPKGIKPMQRVVVVGEKAWSLDRLRKERTLDDGDLILEWHPEQASALDKKEISEGVDVGDVVVQRRIGDKLVDVPHAVTFAFVYFAFNNNSEIVL